MKGCKEDSRMILDVDDNEHTYFVIQKPADQGEILKFELLALLGDSIGELAILFQSQDDEEKAATALSKAVSLLFKNSNPKDVFSFLQKLVIGISRDNERVTLANFNTIYNNNSIEFYRAIAFVLEVNYADFLKGLMSNVSLVAVKAD